MHTMTIIPSLDIAPANELETVRVALHAPAGTHFIVDETGLTAVQIHHEQGPASRVTALVQVPLGQRLTADQLVAALVGLNVLPRNPGDVAQLYGRIGLLPEPQPTAELTNRDEEAAAVSELTADVTITSQLAAADELASQPADTSFTNADLVPCGYRDCQGSKPAGRAIKMHRIRAHGIDGGVLPAASATDTPRAVLSTAGSPMPVKLAVEQQRLPSGRTARTAVGEVSQEEPPPNF
ncbi:MAG: hypothetical protein M3R24_28870 [Chloroflexota bacterium]|nr:hypothetical protein [Chloroflexota bacterium]